MNSAATANSTAAAAEAGETIKTTGDRVEVGFWYALNEFLLKIPHLLGFILAVVASWLIGRLIAGIISRRLDRRGQDDLGRLLGTIVTWLTILVGGLIALMILFPRIDPGSVLSLLGFGSIAIGFAFKDILQNLVAGVILLVREPYRKGDEITVGSDHEYEGVVEEVETRATHIRTLDRRLVVIPNVKIFSNAITVNTSCEFRMTTIKLRIAYGGDPRRALNIVDNAIRRAEGVRSAPEPVVALEALNDYSIDLVIAYPAGAGELEQITTKGAVLLAIHDTCRENGIVFPYPTRVNLLQPYHDEARLPDKLQGLPRSD